MGQLLDLTCTAPHLEGRVGGVGALHLGQRRHQAQRAGGALQPAYRVALTPGCQIGYMAVIILDVVIMAVIK